MPKVSFYLRNEDIETWQRISKKTEFIHKCLTFGYDSSEEPGPVLERFKVPSTPKPDMDENPCKHGFPPLYCKYAKPGKPCK